MMFTFHAHSSFAMRAVGRAFCGLALCFCAAVPKCSFATDLLNLYREALHFDARISAARAAHVAGREALPQARARWLPTVDVQGRAMQESSGTSRIGSTAQIATGYTISLKQPVFNAEAWHGYQRGVLLVTKADIALAKANQELMLRVAEAYLEFLEAQHVASLAKAQRVAVAEQLAQAKASVSLGVTTIVDVHEATASLDQAIADEIDAQGAVDLKQSSLASVIGRKVARGAMPQFKAPLPTPVPSDANVWVEHAEHYAYGVQLSAIAMEIAKRETAKAYAGHMPSVDLIASRESRSRYGGSPYWGGARDESRVGIQIQIPIFSGFSVQSRVRETLALVEQASDELTEARRIAGLEAQKAYLSVTTGLMRIAALEVGETSAQTALESNQVGYEYHVRPSVDVLNAQYKLYRVRRELAQARYRVLMGSLKLKAATASLVEADIAAASALLERT
ncbi:TolC family outer membrane protein [Pandoraea sputorum]|uniref:TolC family outer membrane protein n=1 Tax=Pandoraea sputorum TaxID=93222 RepID=UPI001E3B1173|nr:TolC family outer membrane protein [Pandoraea sputorum]MCE4058973.1 TolC family outer membrane protein [Pandoraea sputorum]